MISPSIIERKIFLAGLGEGRAVKSAEDTLRPLMRKVPAVNGKSFLR